MTYKLDQVRILIVDDMQPMLSLVTSILNIFGFQHVYTALNAEKAFELVCKHDPDIIITDWLMEPTDGLQFVKEVRRNTKSPNPYVPIIMMTGYSARLRVENARDHGVTEFLVKPFSAQDLCRRVIQIVEKPREFVDMDGFFGPDRRRKRGKDYEGPRRRSREEKGSKTPRTPEQKQVMDLLTKLRDEVKDV